MVTVYKVVLVQREEERQVGGTSAAFRRNSRYRLLYRKDEPTTGRFPLYAFEDLASAQAWAGESAEVAIWEAEAPSSHSAPEYCGDNVWDEYIEEFWAHWTSRSDQLWNCLRLCEEAWDCMLSERSYHTQTTPTGTVLCPSITLRRLLSAPAGHPASNGPD
jgi:hypothetical protein